jgi:integrase
VRTWVGLVSVTAGLGYLSPHQLRHTCLAEMHEQTGDLRITQYFAGHADPSTTARYTRATKRALVAAVDTLYRPAA